MDTASAAGRLSPRALTACAALLVTLAAFALYRSTLLPGMDLGDTPSFQTMGGSPLISTRDAYPLYFALAAPFVWWSGDDPAHAMNLASAVEAAIACGLILLVSVELSGSIGAAIVAALVFAGSYTFWSQAVTAEVYALHILCVALVLLALFAWQRRPTPWRLTLLLAIYALGFGNHLGMVLLLPGVTLFLFMTSPGGARALLTPRIALSATACAAAGALQYAWNVGTMLADPVPPRGVMQAVRWFWFDVTKSDWRDTMVAQVPGVMASERLRMFLFDVHQQFGWPMLAVAAAGAAALAATARARALLLLTWLVSTTAFALTYNVGDTHVFLLPTHLVIALLVGPGLTLLSTALSSRLGARARPVVVSTALALTALRIYGEYPALDRSHDQRAQESLARLTSDIDDRRAVLLADLNWQMQNGLNYYEAHMRTDLTFARMPDVLPYAPTLIRDNQAIGREILLSERAGRDLLAAYGPLFALVEDNRVAAASLADRTAAVSPGTRYVFCLVKPTPETPIDRADINATIARLTGGHLAEVPPGDYVAVAGLAGEAPRLVANADRPFHAEATLGGVPVHVRMESWLPFDTIRRMGFGHVVAGRQHSLIVERGVSLVALDGSGRATQVEYAAGVFAPQPRFRLETPTVGAIGVLSLSHGTALGWTSDDRRLPPDAADAARGRIVLASGAGPVPSEEVRHDPRFLRRLRTYLYRRCSAQEADRARAHVDQEAGQDAVGILGARQEDLRLGRREDVLVPPGRQAGDRQLGAADRSGDQPGPLSGGARRSDARLHRIGRRGPCRDPGRHAGAEAGAEDSAAGLRVPDAVCRSGNADAPGPGVSRRPGRHLEFPVHEPEGKRRIGGQGIRVHHSTRC